MKQCKDVASAVYSWTHSLEQTDEAVQRAGPRMAGYLQKARCGFPYELIEGFRKANTVTEMTWYIDQLFEYADTHDIDLSWKV